MTSVPGSPASPARSAASDPPTLREVVEVLERLFPPERAQSWDQVGLVAGDLEQPISLVSRANPPTYLAHGDYDIVVPVGHSDQFAWASHLAKAPIAYDRVMSGPSNCRGHFVMCGVNTTALDAFLD